MRLLILAALPLAFLSFAYDVPKPNDEPGCTKTCLQDYFFHANNTASCAANDNPCICNDPLFPHLVSCCMVGKCSAAERVNGSNWIQWICGAYRIALPNLQTCVPTSQTPSSMPAPLTAAVSSSQLLTSTSVASFTSAAVSTSSPPPAARASSGGPLGLASGVSRSMSSSSEAVPTASRSDAASATILTSQAPSRPSSLLASSSSSSAATASPSAASISTIGLAIGLGLGIPLTICAAGLLGFLFWRHSRHSRDPPPSPSPQPSTSLPIRPGGDTYETGRFTRGTRDASRHLAKRWQPFCAADLIPPPRQPGGGPAVTELAA